MKIYHNPRCKKSREGLELLEKSGKEFEVVRYLENPPSETELRELIRKLGIAPIDLVRKNEAIWKENYKNKAMTDEEVIQTMAKHPKLIERPIVVNDNQAVIGRPPENIQSLLQSP